MKDFSGEKDKDGWNILQPCYKYLLSASVFRVDALKPTGASGITPPDRQDGKPLSTKAKAKSKSKATAGTLFAGLLAHFRFTKSQKARRLRLSRSRAGRQNGLEP